MTAQSTQPSRPPLPHPWPCNYWPEFVRRNDAREFLVRYQEAGHIKRCEHASIGFSPLEPEKFRPICGTTSMIAMPADDREFRSYGDNYLFYGCPAACHYYSPARRAAIVRGIKSTLRGIAAPVLGFPGWFARLSPGVQTMMAACLLVAVLGTFAPRLLAAIAEFIKALK